MLSRAIRAIPARAGAAQLAQRRAFSVLAQDEGRKKRLIWHSKQRGWLELDLLMGGFAERHLMALEPKQIELWEEVLELENPDLFKWLNGEPHPMPEEVKGNEVMQMLLKYVNEEHPASKPGDAPPQLFK
jgi:succinate dehydrogenase flavin-adding protein (antitoxin of CptAB toxin-antitoxin module)